MQTASAALPISVARFGTQPSDVMLPAVACLSIPIPMTLEEFLDSRFDLPDSGQWAELDAGEVVLLQPPDLEHGNAILNFSKAVAAWASTAAAEEAGAMYACFDLGLILTQQPDTVRFPAVSFFAGGNRFAESDKLATDTVPRLVMELASSSDRRLQMPERVQRYFDWGVPTVWVIDPQGRHVLQRSMTGQQRDLIEGDRLTDTAALPGFDIEVSTLFIEPSWWTNGSRR
ncbi:MAG: Uma2 family endonuclease [Planctomycetaceae bacterium]